MKFEDIVVYENSSDKFDIGHCQIKVKVIVGLSHMLQYKLTGPISQLWPKLGSWY